MEASGRIRLVSVRFVCVGIRMVSSLVMRIDMGEGMGNNLPKADLCLP